MKTGVWTVAVLLSSVNQKAVRMVVMLKMWNFKRACFLLHNVQYIERNTERERLTKKWKRKRWWCSSSSSSGSKKITKSKVFVCVCECVCVLSTSHQPAAMPTKTLFLYRPFVCAHQYSWWVRNKEFMPSTHKHTHTKLCIAESPWRECDSEWTTFSSFTKLQWLMAILCHSRQTPSHCCTTHKHKHGLQYQNTHYPNTMNDSTLFFAIVAAAAAAFVELAL